MNMLQVSPKQLTLLVSTTVLSTLAIFSLGLLTATLMTREAASDRIAMIGAQRPAAVAIPATSPIANTEQTDTKPRVAVAQQQHAEQQRYGVQVAVFEQLDNAIQYVALHSDKAFPARIFRRPEAGATTVYPVLVGVFDNMDAAQQAKQAFTAMFASDAFVTDATTLREQMGEAQTLAMVR
jgi:hypothetical protein